MLRSSPVVRYASLAPLMSTNWRGVWVIVVALDKPRHGENYCRYMFSVFSEAQVRRMKKHPDPRDRNNDKLARLCFSARWTALYIANGTNFFLDTLVNTMQSLADGVEPTPVVAAALEPTDDHRVKRGTRWERFVTHIWDP